MAFLTTFFTKYRFWIAGVAVVVIGALLLNWGYQALKPVPDNTTFKTHYFSFTYPRVYLAKEYAPGVVSLGKRTETADGIDPLVEITRYQSDPDLVLPKDFDTFMKRQAGALCGADGPVESISCTQVGVSPYSSTNGVAGSKLDLTLVRKNLKTGTTTSSTYGPMYVFDTSVASSSPGKNYRYTAIFIYPSLASFLNGTTSPAIIDQVLSTLVLTP